MISQPRHRLIAMWRSLKGAFLFAALLVALIPSTVLAHAYPVRSTPSPNVELSHAPPTVEIWFTEHLEPSLSSMVVYDERERQVQAGPSHVDSNDSYHLIVPLPSTLPKGTYTVVWHAVSADDGHSTAGVFAFGVGEASELPVISPQQLGVTEGQQVTPYGVFGRWLTYLGAALVLGAAALALMMTRPIERGVAISGDARGGLARYRLSSILLPWSYGLLVFGQGLRLVDEVLLSSVSASSVIPGGTQRGGLATVLFQTRFGELWFARTGLIVAGLAFVALSDRKRMRPIRGFWIGTLVVGVGLVSDLAWSGHAAAGSLLAYLSLIQTTIGWSAVTSLYMTAIAILVNVAGPLTLAIDWLHLVAVSVWIGGLVALGFALWRRDRGEPAEQRWDGAIIARFSRVATVGMIVVLLTGLYNTWMYLAGPGSYVGTGYGQSLLVKHAFILALLLAAGLNHFVTVPSMTNGRLPRWIPSTIARGVARNPDLSLRVEAGLGLIVLLATGVLTSLGPARVPGQILLAPNRELALAAEPFRAARTLPNGEAVQLEMNPGRVGKNAFTVRVSQGGEPARDVQRVYLEITPLDIGATAANVIPLTPAGTGTFTANGLELSASGNWQVAVRVYQTSGSVQSASVTIQATEKWAAEVDPAATKLIHQAVAAMSQLRTARLVYAISDGASGMDLTQFAFVAPDREETTVPLGGTAIQIGKTVYLRDGGSTTWTIQPNSPLYTWPKGEFSEFEDGVGGIIVGHGSVLGHDCTVVAFYSTQFEGVYEEWIGNDDHLIHEFVIAAPSHYMISLYHGFNTPIQVVPPVQR